MHREETENNLRKLGNSTKREFKDINDRLRGLQDFPVPSLSAFMYACVCVCVGVCMLQYIITSLSSWTFGLFL